MCGPQPLRNLRDKRLPAYTQEEMPRDEARRDLPEGFLLQPDFLSASEESALIEFVQTLAFGHVTMRGVASLRRVAQFGLRYAFESARLTPAAPLPDPLEPLRERAAALAQIEPIAFAEALVTEYPAGAGIRWHRDAPLFGIVAGISLAAPCRMRFQRGAGTLRETAAVELPPRSIYLLTGPARKEWQHMLPPVRQTRWSITFRTLRGRPKR
jgi:alkylated DNA repair protein (DNA oxidative demethylase)